MPTYYEVFGIASTATPTDIKKAYRGLALLFHPDKRQELAKLLHPAECKNEVAEEIFKLIANIYDVLINPQTKQQYDTNIHSTVDTHANKYTRTIQAIHAKAKQAKEKATAEDQQAKRLKEVRLKKEEEDVARETEIAQRTAEIKKQEVAAEEILNTMLRQEVEVLKNFLSTISHELKQFPYTTILKALNSYLAKRPPDLIDVADLKEIFENLWSSKLALDDSDAASALRQKLLQIADFSDIENILCPPRLRDAWIPSAINEIFNAYLVKRTIPFHVGNFATIFFNILKKLHNNEKYYKSEKDAEIRNTLRYNLLLQANFELIQQALSDAAFIQDHELSFLSDIFDAYLERRPSSAADNETFGIIFYNLWKKLDIDETPAALILRNKLLLNASVDIVQQRVHDETQIKKLPPAVIEKVLEAYLNKLSNFVTSLPEDSNLETLLDAIKINVNIFAEVLFNQAKIFEDDGFVSELVSQCLMKNQIGPNRIFAKLLYQNLVAQFIDYFNTQAEGERKQALLYASYDNTYDIARFPLLRLAKTLDVLGNQLFHQTYDADMEPYFIKMATMNEVFKLCTQSITAKSLTLDLFVILASDNCTHIMRKYLKDNKLDVIRLQHLMKEVVLTYKSDSNKIKLITENLSAAFNIAAYNHLKSALLLAQYYVRVCEEASGFSETDKKNMVLCILETTDVEINKKFLALLTPEEYMRFLLIHRTSVGENTQEAINIEKKIIDACKDKNVLFHVHDKWTNNESTEEMNNYWLHLTELLDLNLNVSSKQSTTNNGNVTQLAETKVTLASTESQYLANSKTDHVFEKDYKGKYPSKINSWWNGRRERIEHYWGKSVYCPMSLRVLASWLWFGKPEATTGKKIDTKFDVAEYNWTKWSEGDCAPLRPIVAADTGVILSVINTTQPPQPMSFVEQLRRTLISSTSTARVDKVSHAEKLPSIQHTKHTLHHSSSSVSMETDSTSSDDDMRSRTVSLASNEGFAGVD